jgi:hypothetical protein
MTGQEEDGAMSWPDMVNGSYEALAGVFVLNHCRVLLRHKSWREHRVDDILRDVGDVEPLLLSASRSVVEFLWRDIGGVGERALDSVDVAVQE